MKKIQDKSDFAPSKEICPKCGKHAGLPIAFGMPTEPDEETRYYFVAYCTYLSPGINMGCTKCHHKWHSPSFEEPSR